MEITMLTVRLEASDRPALRAHFLALGSEDRRLRFGFHARDNTIERYVKDIDFTRDAVFGVRSGGGDARQFEGITHVALEKNHAEIGVSVLKPARGQGIGSALVSRAAVHACNRGIEVLYMQCLSENCAIMRIARSLGMKVVTLGSDSEARMTLPAGKPASIVAQTAAAQIALCDAALCDDLMPNGSKRPSVAPTLTELLASRLRAAA
jgi:RimJ/RimL family protein N-acetyltransferase